MKTKRFPVLLLLIAILLVGCNEQSSNQQCKQVDLSDNWQSSEEVLLSTIAEDIEYIPLETSPDCLIGNHRALEVTPVGEYLIVHEHNKVMRIFSREGKYLCDVGVLGKGPDEYQHSNSFYVDETSKQIYILSIRKDCLIFVFDSRCSIKSRTTD